MSVLVSDVTGRLLALDVDTSRGMYMYVYWNTMRIETSCFSLSAMIGFYLIG